VSSVSIAPAGVTTYPPGTYYNGCGQSDATMGGGPVAVDPNCLPQQQR
jgi:hypothetical protein